MLVKIGDSMRISIDDVSMWDVMEIMSKLRRNFDDIFIEVEYNKETNTYHSYIICRNEEDYIEIANFLKDYKYQKSFGTSKK